jgi:membrane fusion protein (multidrug efflux system)
MKGVIVRAIILAIALAIGGVMLIDWNAITFAGGPAETNDAQLRGDPSILMARVPGLVTGDAIDDDQPVHRGQLLFQIEDDTYRAALRAANAASDRARAQLALLRAQRQAQADRITGSQRQADAANARLAFARQDAARWNALAGTPGDLLRARQDADATERQQAALLDSDRQAVAIARATLARLDAQIDQATHALAAEEAALRLAAIDLGWTRITAPEDGVVTERAVHPGQYVTAGTPLIRFVPLPRVWAVAWYREEQVHAMRAGQHVRIHVDAFPGLTIDGCVQSIAPVSQAYDEALPPDQATGTFTKVVQRIPIKITFPTGPGSPIADLGRFLIPGLSVETHVDIAGPADCVPAPGR